MTLCVRLCHVSYSTGREVPAHGVAAPPWPWVTLHPQTPPQAHTDSLNTLVALHQLYQYTQKYYDQVGIFLGWQHWAAPPRPVA